MLTILGIFLIYHMSVSYLQLNFQQINVIKCPSSIRTHNNLEHEPPSVTTRPWLPPKQIRFTIEFELIQVQKLCTIDVFAFCNHFLLLLLNKRRFGKEASRQRTSNHFNRNDAIDAINGSRFKSDIFTTREGTQGSYALRKRRLNCFLKKWTNPGLFLFIFVLFALQFQYKLKKA